MQILLHNKNIKKSNRIENVLYIVKQEDNKKIKKIPLKALIYNGKFLSHVM